MNKVAIDLTWLRHQKVGGSEAYIINIISAFAEDEQNSVVFYLLVAKDNANVFKQFEKNNNFEFVVCNTISSNQKKRVLWQNFHLGDLLRKKGIDICFEPIYSMPFIGIKGIRFVTTIHDLQALHYPEYWSWLRVVWMKLSWRNTVKNAYRIIAISEYVKNDILTNFKVGKDRIAVIYNIIQINKDNIEPTEYLSKFGVCEKKYYYTVSSLLPHKNLKTLIQVMKTLKEKNSFAFLPLIVSGVGGKMYDELQKMIVEYNLENKIILTQFLEDSERNLLYKQCKAFLFPSIFEGFGMPPIEAMVFGVPVITTEKTSIREVTQGKAIYIENPYDVNMWIKSIENIYPEKCQCTFSNDNYNKENITKEMKDLFERVAMN